MNPIYQELPALLNVDSGTPLTVIEIGAADGGDTRNLRFTLPHATIYAFEPDPRNLYLIKKDGTDKVAHVIEAAVGDRDGTAEFRLSSGAPPKGHPLHGVKTWSWSSSLKAPSKHREIYPWIKFDQVARVPIIKLDTFCAQRGIGSIDFLWADVQGAEDQLIAGGAEAFKRVRYFYTEYNDVELYEGQIPLSEIIARLNALTGGPGVSGGSGGTATWSIVKRWGEDVLLRNNRAS